MKQGKSTKPPNKAELEYILACKQTGCVCCWLIGYGWVYGEFHHFLRGSRRRGHMHGICLCSFHHRGAPLEGMTVPQTRKLLGPSLMDGSKVFHAEWGSDDELYEIQQQLLEAAT